MKKPIYLAVLLAAIVLFMAGNSFSVPMDQSNNGQLLVLGFRSDYLDDVQERIFREGLMRKLQSRGYALVPVMEIEEVLQDDASLNIRNIHAGQLPGICASLKAQYTVTGIIDMVSPFTTLPDQEQKKTCHCNMSIVDLKNDKTTSYSFIVPYNESLEVLFNAVSDKMTEIVEKSEIIKKEMTP